MKFSSFHPFAYLSLIAFCLSITMTTVSAKNRITYPGAEWEKDPSGLSPKIRHRIDEYVHALDTTGLMVIRHGRVAYQYGDVQGLTYIASSRKSVLAMLYGPYVANGTIRLDRTLKDLGMTDIGGLLPIEERAKIVDLISARSGVYHPASNSGDFLDAAPKRGSQEPGSYWLYSNWDFNAAGAAFERMTGENIYDAFRDDLAIPIGMQDFQRDRQRKRGDFERSQYPAYHMWLSTRDMARLAYLMLRHGRWNDRQLIPSDWIDRITSIVTPRTQLNPAFLRDLPFGYGYMWWAWDNSSAKSPFKGAYTSWGALGQYITVLPSRDIVVAHKTIPMNRETPIGDYLLLLDRVVGKRPASEEILPALWTKGEDAAFALGERLKAKPGDRIVDESDLYAAGVALLRQGQTRRYERTLLLNLRLFPNSFRTLMALSRFRASEGENSQAIELARKALALRPNNSLAKVQLIHLGAPVEGHIAKESPIDKLRPLAGVYLSKDTRYVVEPINGHLMIHTYFDGELDDEYEVFADDAGLFYAPAHSAILQFKISDGLAQSIDSAAGEDSWHAARGQ